ncbi:MAG: hypothetical protein AAGH42_11770 [Pseudomonadota bacterium]
MIRLRDINIDDLTDDDFVSDTPMVAISGFPSVSGGGTGSRPILGEEDITAFRAGFDVL